MRKSWGDLIGGAVLLVVGVYAVLMGVKLGLGRVSDPQPGFFPFWSGMAITVMSAILLVTAAAGRCRSKQEAFGAVGRLAVMVVGMAVYVAVIEILGYLIATTVLAVLMLWILGTRKWWTLALATVILAGGSYFLFDRLLNVTLPAGILAGIL